MKLRHSVGEASQCSSGPPDIACPFHDRDILVTACGRICMHQKKIKISHVLAGQRFGL